MKRIKIFKAYFILWLFVYFIAVANFDTFKTYFLSTLTFNIAIVTILSIGTFMLLKGAKDLVMMAGTFGVLMYKKHNLHFYLNGIEKVLPSTFAQKILHRVDAGALYFTQQEKEDLLGWISEMFSNQNKYNNFFIGTVLMIGLLGTFAGLLGAIGSMGAIVKSLAGSNVDIGKIMAGFSGPLGSMAVGFGSSLFGVISAILLSIKGYLLNKSQASLLDGVENWLNGITIEQIDSDFEQTRPSASKGYLDLFLEQIGSLSKEIRGVSQTHHELKQAFIDRLDLLHEQMRKQSELLHSSKLKSEQLTERMEETLTGQRHIAQTLSQLLQEDEMHHERVLSRINRLVHDHHETQKRFWKRLESDDRRQRTLRMHLDDIANHMRKNDQKLSHIYDMQIDRLEATTATRQKSAPIAQNEDFWTMHFRQKVEQ